MTDNKIKIIIAGDLLPSGKNIPLFEQGDSQKLFGEDICNLFASSNYSILNLEGPLTDSEKKGVKSGATIKAPQKCINGIKSLGVNVVALANNHIKDYGNQGFFDTISALKDAQIDYIGVGKSLDEIKKYHSVSINGVPICFYNVSETFFNSATTTTPGAHLYDEYLVCKELNALKNKHSLVVVLYHGGSEFVQYPTIQTRTRFHRMADNGADIIIAQHTHCIGCEEYYNGSYLLYGQGNFSFARQKNRCPKLSREGLLLQINYDNHTYEINKIRVELSDRDVTRISDNQNFTAFNERCKMINDDIFLQEELSKAKVGEHLLKYLLAFQGYKTTSLFVRFGSRFCPSLLSKYLIRKFDKELVLRNSILLQSDRLQEDISTIWNYIYKQID